MRKFQSKCGLWSVRFGNFLRLLLKTAAIFTMINGDAYRISKYFYFVSRFRPINSIQL